MTTLSSIMRGPVAMRKWDTIHFCYLLSILQMKSRTSVDESIQICYVSALQERLRHKNNFQCKFHSCVTTCAKTTYWSVFLKSYMKLVTPSRTYIVFFPQIILKIGRTFLVWCIKHLQQWNSLCQLKRKTCRAMETLETYGTTINQAWPSCVRRWSVSPDFSGYCPWASTPKRYTSC